MSLINRFRYLFNRRKAEQELDEELRHHIELKTKENIAAGMTAEEARYAALRAFGGVEQKKEQCRDADRMRWLEDLIQDLRYGLRQLRRNRGFTAVAVITLALGIGANTAIFSLIDAVMLRSMPVRDPAQLVLLRWEAHQWPQHLNMSSFGDCPGASPGENPSGCSFSLPFFEEMHSEGKLFSGVVAFAGPEALNMLGNGPPVTGSGELVSGSYFPALGVTPALGRLIGPKDDSPQASPVLALSYAYWQSAFGGARSVIGRSIVLNNVPFTIAGVAPPSFTGLSPGKTQDFWLPIAIAPRLGVGFVGIDIHSVSNWWLVVVARMKPGISLAQAQAAASLAFRDQALHATEKPIFKAQDDPAIRLLPAAQGLTGLRGFFSKPLYVLMFAVGIILLIACANVAGLLLARGTARQKEMAVRLAVGAGRGRIVRQLLTESVMLSVAGGVLGILFAFWGVHALTEMLWGHFEAPIAFVVGPDWRVLTFTVLISLVTGIIFGLAPALRSTLLDLAPALNENASTVRASSSKLRRRIHLGDSLVVAQVALSVVLLAGAGLLVRTLVNMRGINPGFDTQNLLLFGIDPTSLGYKDPEIQNLYRELRTRLAALPGVASVSYSSLLLAGNESSTDAYVEGQTAHSQVDLVYTGPGLLGTLRIPLLDGRALTPSDFEQAEMASAAGKGGNPSSPPQSTKKPAGPPIPALVNRTLVRKLFPHENPLGKRLGNDKSNPGAWEIVGVVGDVKVTDLRQAVNPTVYLPLTGGSAYFELRTAGDPAALIPAVRKLASQVASRLPIFDVHTQAREIDNLLFQETFLARVSAFFAALALLLACIGLYGLLSYEVGRRTREIGIRVALGARRADILTIVVVRGLKLAVVGAAIGIGGALALTRLLSSLLYGVKPGDSLTLVTVSLMLTGVALIACYIPARRATKVDPMVALRCE